jgi:hypothetical protein
MKHLNGESCCIISKGTLEELAENRYAFSISPFLIPSPLCGEETQLPRPHSTQGK